MSRLRDAWLVLIGKRVAVMPRTWTDLPLSWYLEGRADLMEGVHVARVKHVSEINDVIEHVRGRLSIAPFDPHGASEPT